MTQKTNNITYSLLTTSILKRFSVSIGFKCHTSLSAINFLSCGCLYEEIKYEDLDAAAVCLAIYNVVQSVLTKSAIDEIKNKIDLLGYGYNNGEFFINADMTSGSALKKFIKVVLKCISPRSKYASIYKALLERKCCRADRGAFVHWCNKINKDLESNICVTIVTSDKVTTEKLKALADDTCDAKVISPQLEGGKVRTGVAECACKHPEHKDKEYTEYFTIKGDGVALGVIKKYIESLINSTIQVKNSELLLPKMYEKHIQKIKDKGKFAAFVETKYSKYKDELGPIMACIAIQHLYDNPSKIAEYKNIDLNNIVKLL